MDCSLSGSSVHVISQARILEWVAISSSRGSSWPSDQIRISWTCRQILYHWVTREAPVSTGKPYIYKYLNLDRRDVWCFHCKQWTQRFPLFSKLYSPPLPALWAAIPSTQLFWLTLMTPWFPCVYTLNPIHLMTATSKTPPNWPLWTIFTDTILGPSHHHFSIEPPE